MKTFLVISLGLLFGLNTFAQSVATGKNSPVTIEEITLTRDDGKGKAGDVAENFLITDIPIHCFIQLDSDKATTVKLILVAVKAVGLKPETKSVSVSFTTDGEQNQVNFNASPKGVWAAGTYRADIYINEKLAASRTFEIEKPLQAAKNKQLAAPKSLAPRLTNKKPRKN